LQRCNLIYCLNVPQFRVKKGWEGVQWNKGNQKEADKSRYERHDFPLHFKGLLTLKYFCGFMSVATKILLSHECGRK